MKAALIVESFAYGTAKSVKQLCAVLKSDWDITVFYGMRDGTELELDDLDPGIDWVALPGKGPHKHLSNLMFLKRRISSDTRVIHGHSTIGGAYAKLVGLRKRNATVLYSPRGYAFLRQDYARWLRAGFWCFEKLTGGWGTTVACGPSEHQMARTLSASAKAINNGYDVPENIDLNLAGQEILSVGRVSPQKGFDLLKEIAASRPGETFVWIGSAEKGCEHLLRDKPDNVRLVPYLPHDELLDRIRRARFVLLPSRWEGLSRVLIESICHGKAIVTSRCPANIDCLAPTDLPPNSFQYDNGFACEDIPQYLQAIDMLKTDDELLRKMQSASYRYACDSFHMDAIAQRWRDLYLSAEATSAVPTEPLLGRQQPATTG